MIHPVEAFNTLAGIQVDEPSGATLRQRVLPLIEESREVEEAVDRLIGKYRLVAATDLAEEHTLKELMDLQFTIQSLCVAMGWDHIEAYERVCLSNLSKLRGGAKIHSSGKVLKGDTYVPPNLRECVQNSKYERMSTEDV